MRFAVRVYRVGFYVEPNYEGEFIGSPGDAERHLSDMWNEHTPADGTGYRATLRETGQRRIHQAIGW